MSDVDELLARLDSSVGSLVERVQKVPEHGLYVAPGQDDWSLMQVMAHMAELLPYWAKQAKAVAERPENGQPFGRTHDDPDRIAAVDVHGRDPLPAVLPRVREGLEFAKATVRDISPQGWMRTAQHPRRGDMTVQQIVEQFLVDHAEEHAKQAEEILTRGAPG